MWSNYLREQEQVKEEATSKPEEEKAVE